MSEIADNIVVYTTNEGRTHEFDALEFLALMSCHNLSRRSLGGAGFQNPTSLLLATTAELTAEAYDDFVGAVSVSRNIPLDKVKRFADGRIILGSTAKEIKLIDELGSIYDAARAVFDILGTPLAEGEDPTLMYTDDRFSELKQIFESATSVLTRASGEGFQLRYVLQ